MRALSKDPVNSRWLTIGLAGRGSTATVYRGFDLVTERLVAIKAFRRPRSGGAGRELEGSGIEARREFARQAGLRHPNLVELHEFAIAESGPLPAGTPFFSMELLESGSLEAGGGGASPSGSGRLARIALDLLSALDCIHAHGLVHNDIKPSNVLRASVEGKETRIKLADFGLASRKRRAPPPPGTLSGTIHYLAPETIAGMRPDARADLYSLGVLLYEAATGALPFDDADPAAALDWHLRGSRSEPRSVGALFPTLARVIARLLAVRPEARFARARDAWEEIAGALPPDEALPGIARAPAPEMDGPLVGRAAEEARIAAWLEDGARGEGWLRILGSSGSGLSRHAREAALAARRAGWSVHSWTSAPGDPPFAPLRRPLREIILRGCRVAPPVRPPSLEQVLALLGGPALWSAPGRLEGARGPLAASISAFLAGQRLAHPLVIVIDDFDRADAGSRLVIESLVRGRLRPPSRILVVTTERAAPPEESASSVSLRPLADRQARRLIRTLPGLMRLPAEREIEALVRLADGRPGRLVRLSRAMIRPQRVLFPPTSVREAGSTGS